MPSGWGSGFAFAKESVYGTPVTTTKAMEILSDSLTLQKAPIRVSTLRGNGYLPSTTSVRPGSKVGGGDVQTLLYTHGTAALTEAMLGAIATTGAGPYVHTATVGPTLPSYSLQVTPGATTATMKKAIEGAKVASWEIAITQGELVTLGLTWVYQDEIMSTGASLAGTYPTGASAYSANDFGTLTIGGVVYCVTALTISGDNGLADSLPCIGQTTISDPPAQERAITGTVTVKLDTSSLTLYNAFMNDTPLALVATGTQTPSIFTANASIILTSGTPTVPGPDELTVSYPFEVRRATTDAAAFSLVTTNSDTTP